MSEQPITFSFGKNWQSFLSHLSEDAISMAIADTKEWLPDSEIRGRSIIDIGCGSGLSSLCFHRRGAGSILSFDYDPNSVAATRSLWEREGRPANWRVEQGSILDQGLMTKLSNPGFDVVYSWGVLHHTGSMWQAIENARRLVKSRGWLWIALYAKGDLYPRHLALKQRYNAAGPFGKWVLERKLIYWTMRQRIREKKNPLTWNQRRERGMDIWHDIVDWLGGLPYEVASIEEIERFASSHHLTTIRVKPSEEGGNHIFLLSDASALNT